MDNDVSKQIDFHFETLPSETKKALNFLAKQNWLFRSSWYLAGGTALALQVGHRKSFDLDFFTGDKEFNQQAIAAHFPSELWKTERVYPGTLFGELAGAKVSFIAYPFFKSHQPLASYGT